MLNNSTSAAILPMQCYMQPFWKHSDIEIYNESNLDTMGRMSDNCIDLTVTSPPYDNLRDYKGYSFEFEEVAKELYRVTKPGGVVVWVVGDETKDGSESGTSFRQALYFMQMEFKLHDTMIYAKENPMPLTHNRYEQSFEYMFVFSKGKPKTFNGLKVTTKDEGKLKIYNAGNVNAAKKEKMDGMRYRDEKIRIGKDRLRFNIFSYAVSVALSNDKIAFEHPAIFPEQLAADHIYSWSNEGDVIYEPFGGSGTVAKMCHLMNRKCIMSEISLEYCQLSVKRLTPYVSQSRLFV